MTKKLYCRLTPTGTACGETCLCEDHLEAYKNSSLTRPWENNTSLEYHDVTGNPECLCQVCGIAR